MVLVVSLFAESVRCWFLFHGEYFFAFYESLLERKKRSCDYDALNAEVCHQLQQDDAPGTVLLGSRFAYRAAEYEKYDRRNYILWNITPNLGEEESYELTYTSRLLISWTCQQSRWTQRDEQPETRFRRHRARSIDVSRMKGEGKSQTCT